MDNSEKDWRVLPQLKELYVKNVWEKLENGFPMGEASDHYIAKIERFWFLKIDEEIAIQMLLTGQASDLRHLIAVSLALDNETKWRDGLRF